MNLTIDQVTQDRELCTLAYALQKRLTMNFENGAITYNVIGKHGLLIKRIANLDYAIELYNSVTGFEK
jgi:hypothetical protein